MSTSGPTFRKYEYRVPTSTAKSVLECRSTEYFGHRDPQIRVGTIRNKTYIILTILNPLTAGAAYIRVFVFYQHHIFNMLKIKCDINQQDLKRVDLHFVKSE